MEGLLTSAELDTCLIALLNEGQYVPHLSGWHQVTWEREYLCGVSGQKVRNRNHKPQGSLERQGGPILIGGTEFEKYIASRADEKNLRKTLPVIADTGLNAPKRKEQKKQTFVSSSMKKIKEIAETVLKNKSACNQ